MSRSRISILGLLLSRSVALGNFCDLPEFPLLPLVSV